MLTYDTQGKKTNTKSTYVLSRKKFKHGHIGRTLPYTRLLSAEQMPYLLYGTQASMAQYPRRRQSSVTLLRNWS